MRRLISIITAVMMTALIFTTSASAAYAADDVLTINGEGKVNVGDTVKFTLYLDETKEDIIGFELRLFYNSEYLKFDKQSLTSEKFDNLFYNPDIDGKIPMNWTDIGNPVSFATKDVFLSCEFEVIKGGEASIEYFVTEMYGDDMTYLKSYKWTYDLEVNDKKVITDGVPPILPVMRKPSTNVRAASSIMLTEWARRILRTRTTTSLSRASITQPIMSTKMT